MSERTSESTSGTVAGRVAAFIVRLYPDVWQARYAAEALDLLALCSPSWGDVANLAYHALYTWLHPDLLADGAVPAYRTLAELLREVWSRDVATVWALGAAMTARARRPRPGDSAPGEVKERS